MPRTIATVVGNPSPGSRTLAAATLVAEHLAQRWDLDEVTVHDLAELGPALLAWGDERVAAAKAEVLASSALVVASPTYKASFTGLAKLFLDQFDRDELAGKPTVPLMTGGSEAHSLAVEVHLRPVLVEIGASCPTRGIYIHGEQVDSPGEAIARWEAASARALDAVSPG